MHWVAVEEPKPEPTFHEFASEWVDRRLHEVNARTVEYWRWALSCHLLSYFGGLFPSQIGVATVDDYKLSKLREREHLEALRMAHPDKRVEGGLSR